MDDIKYSSTHHQHEHSRTNYDDQLDYGTPASQSDAQVTPVSYTHLTLPTIYSV